MPSEHIIFWFNIYFQLCSDAAAVSFWSGPVALVDESWGPNVRTSKSTA